MSDLNITNELFNAGKKTIAAKIADSIGSDCSDEAIDGLLNALLLDLLGNQAIDFFTSSLFKSDSIIERSTPKKCALYPLFSPSSAGLGKIYLAKLRQVFPKDPFLSEKQAEDLIESEEINFPSSFQNTLLLLGLHCTPETISAYERLARAVLPSFFLSFFMNYNENIVGIVSGRDKFDILAFSAAKKSGQSKKSDTGSKRPAEYKFDLKNQWLKGKSIPTIPRNNFPANSDMAVLLELAKKYDSKLKTPSQHSTDFINDWGLLYAYIEVLSKDHRHFFELNALLVHADIFLKSILVSLQKSDELSVLNLYFIEHYCQLISGLLPHFYHYEKWEEDLLEHKMFATFYYLHTSKETFSCKAIDHFISCLSKNRHEFIDALKKADITLTSCLDHIISLCGKINFSDWDMRIKQFALSSCPELCKKVVSESEQPENIHPFIAYFFQDIDPKLFEHTLSSEKLMKLFVSLKDGLNAALNNKNPYLTLNTHLLLAKMLEVLGPFLYSYRFE